MTLCACNHYTVNVVILFVVIKLIKEVSLVISETTLGVSYNYSIVTMSLNNEQVITSPGYPHTDYERDTNYTWYVVADDAVEEIFLNITMQIQRTKGYPCDDYLQVCVL